MNYRVYKLKVQSGDWQVWQRVEPSAGDAEFIEVQYRGDKVYIVGVCLGDVIRSAAGHPNAAMMDFDEPRACWPAIEILHDMFLQVAEQDEPVPYGPTKRP